MLNAFRRKKKNLWAVPETEKWMQIPHGGVLSSLCPSLPCSLGLKMPPSSLFAVFYLPKGPTELS